MSNRIEEIKARAEAATPGPWLVHPHESAEGQLVVDEHYDNVAECYVPEDATFIAHAREDIPYLLAEVERLRAALEGER